MLSAIRLSDCLLFKNHRNKVELANVKNLIPAKFPASSKMKGPKASPLIRVVKI